MFAYNLEEVSGIFRVYQVVLVLILIIFINYMYIDGLLYGVAFDSMVTNFPRPPFTYKALKGEFGITG